MKTRLIRKLVMIMTFALAVPLFWNLNIAKVQAATPTPTFVQTKVEIVGTAQTYQLEIKDKVSKSTYKWSSSNTSIATVTSKGVVTSIDKGTATIKCKITYPTKKTKTISCKVTVKVPATKITISNTTIINGSQKMLINTTMDFDMQLTPSNSSDKVYWYIDKGDAGCIRIDDAALGKITALKAGFVTLRARAAVTSTKEAADLSNIDDAVIIEVVEPEVIVPKVKTAEIISSNQITIVFESPVNANTLIGVNNKLTDNVVISMVKDAKQVLADDPGAFMAMLSADLKTLTITSTNAFNGNYGIECTSGILTTDGTAIESYYKKVNYTDTMPPAYVGVTLDDSGFIATINFSEALNFTNLKINGAALVSNGLTASDATIGTLNNVLNYTVSTDKKSLTINLSKIVPADYGKLFSVYISGVTDLKGNLPANVFLTAYLQTDNAQNKPQAQVLSVIRTSYDYLTVTFDRGIRVPGYIQIAGGTMTEGVINTTNNKKVNFKIPSTDVSSTGMRQVSIGLWSAFNVTPTDTSASLMRTYSADFTTDSTSPFLLTSEYNAEKAILTLTYNENVTLATASGIFVSTLTTRTEDIVPNTNITYTKVTHTDGDNIIKLQLVGVTTIGSYSFAFDQGFVTDNFKNKSAAKAMMISSTGSASTELPAPYSIIQSTTNLSQIYVKFMNKLDVATATNVSNYSIAGIAIISAEVKENSAYSGTVLLTVLDGSIAAEVARPIVIKGVAGYNNSYAAITSYQTSLSLKENLRPNVVNYTFDTTSRSMVKLNFNEIIQGTMTVKVSQLYAGVTTDLLGTVSISGSTVNISIPVVPNGSLLTVTILTNTIADVNGNTAATMPPIYNVNVNY